jgi:hypothetical protein
MYRRTGSSLWYGCRQLQVISAIPISPTGGTYDRLRVVTRTGSSALMKLFQKAWDSLHRETDVPERVMVLGFINKGHEDVRADHRQRLECWKRNLIIDLNEFQSIGGLPAVVSAYGRHKLRYS